MFNAMLFADHPVQEWLLLGIAVAGFLVGLYWIQRITNDIEDN